MELDCDGDGIEQVAGRHSHNLAELTSELGGQPRVKRKDLESPGPVPAASPPHRAASRLAASVRCKLRADQPDQQYPAGPNSFEEILLGPTGVQSSCTG